MKEKRTYYSARKNYCPNCWASDNKEICPNDKCLMKIINEYFSVYYKDPITGKLVFNDNKVKINIFKKAINEIIIAHFIDLEEDEIKKKRKSKKKRNMYVILINKNIIYNIIKYINKKINNTIYFFLLW